MGRKNRGRAVHGVVLLNKPLGMSSNHLLQKVKRLFNAAKAGHTGALDPLATGLLPICLGEATKFSQLLLESDKAYETIGKLGERTSTLDAEGEVTETRPVPELNIDHVNQIIQQQFVGTIKQVAPLYSALKIDGKPMYEWVRKGVEVEAKVREVTINSIELESLTQEQIQLQVSCSKGTYIRSLVDDIGQELGCGAYITKLHRTEHGPYQIKDSVTLEQLETLADKLLKESPDYSELDSLLLPVDSPIADWPMYRLTEAEHIERFTHGNPAKGVKNTESLPDTDAIRVYDDNSGMFLGIGEKTGPEQLSPRRLVNL